MRAIIEKGLPSGTFLVPPSKSYSHRSMIAAAIAGGGTVSNLAICDDVCATLDCLASLGMYFDYSGGRLLVCEGIKPQDETVTLNCNESGSTLRFMIPIALALGGKFVFTGKERLFARGIGEYEKIFAEKGIYYEKYADKLIVEGKLDAGNYSLRGDVSSQFVTGLLFALSMAGGGKITLGTKVESRPYIDMTIQVLEKHGITVEEGDGEYIVKGGQKFATRSAKVEGDWSNAAFLGAFGYLGADVTLKGLNENSVQGDRVWKSLFPDICSGIADADISDCPDLAPVAFALAALTKGGKFRGTARLKIKESDRAEAMKEELAKIGSEVVTGENSVEIFPATKAPTAPFSSHGDHRVAMALSVVCAAMGGEITGAEAVGKSFPGFFDTLKRHGVKMRRVKD